MEEQLRLRQAHQRHSAGFLDGYFGGGASLIDEHHPAASAAAPAFRPALASPHASSGGRVADGTPAPAAAAVSAAQADPLAVFRRVDQPSRPAASPSVAPGNEDGRPSEGLAGEEGASSSTEEDAAEAAERAAERAAGMEWGGDDETERREEKAKTQRLKKLLGAADKRLQQAESDLVVRDAEVAALKYRLSLDR